jgi:hypothetical protein
MRLGGAPKKTGEGSRGFTWCPLFLPAGFLKGLLASNVQYIRPDHSAVARSDNSITIIICKRNKVLLLTSNSLRTPAVAVRPTHDLALEEGHPFSGFCWPKHPSSISGS